MTLKTSIILHGINEGNADTAKDSLKSILNLNDKNFDCCIIGSKNEELSGILADKNISYSFTGSDSDNLSIAVNKALEATKGDYVLYIDNSVNTVKLKKASLEAFHMSAARNENAGYF
ncbi:MAG: glycosyltransferase family 2 protein, partial [Candidatus Marinimicrobia bacterium]|nr:glycosyltransferase family 2 protein [Candidatus Neomarinimicrobiota bacterium]